MGLRHWRSRSGRLSVVWLVRYSTNQSELFLGAAAAAVACLVLFLLGALAARVHLAASAGKTSWRARRLELFSHAAGLTEVLVGGWLLAATSPNLPGMIAGSLLIFTGYAAILSLGCWSTLSQISAD